MSNILDDAPLHIETMTYEHREVRVLPPGGNKTTRIKTRTISLPRISILSPEVEQFLNSPLVTSAPARRTRPDRTRRRSR